MNTTTKAAHTPTPDVGLSASTDSIEVTIGVCEFAAIREGKGGSIAIRPVGMDAWSTVKRFDSWAVCTQRLNDIQDVIHLGKVLRPRARR